MVVRGTVDVVGRTTCDRFPPGHRGGPGRFSEVEGVGEREALTPSLPLPSLPVTHQILNTGTREGRESV